MPTLAEHLGYRYATCTRLRCTGWVHSQHCTTSLFRFVTQDFQEAAPCGIIYGLGQYAASQPLDVQIFNKDHTIVIHQPPRRFVMKISSGIAHAGVSFLQHLNGFTPSFRASLASGNPTLSDPQFSLCVLIPARIVNHGPIAEYSKTRQSQVNANVVIEDAVCTIFNLYVQADVPASSFPLDGDCLDASRGWAVKLYLDFAPHLGRRACHFFAIGTHHRSWGT